MSNLEDDSARVTSTACFFGTSCRVGRALTLKKKSTFAHIFSCAANEPDSPKAQRRSWESEAAH